jgi:hypothetical protein
MHRLNIDRRAALPATGTGTDRPEMTRIVRQALLLQAYFGSVGAIEYLKAHEVSGELIVRLMSGERLRAEDHVLRAESSTRQQTLDSLA